MCYNRVRGFFRTFIFRKPVSIMSKHENISAQVIKRLPRYYRFLGELLDKNITRISSRELSDRMHITASQIRQDLNCFGGFGQQGYGYSVYALHEQIGNILGIGNQYSAILIGAGNLGRAVSTHMSFEKRGFRLTAIFDSDKNKVGQKIRNIEIMDTDELENFCNEYSPDVAILCVPKEASPALAGRLYACGIKNYWNFSHYDLSLDFDDVIVENVHLNDSLMILCYRITDNREKCINDESETEVS